VFEYQAPKDDFKNFQSTSQFVKRYIIFWPLAMFCIYKMAVVRRNKFSNQKEFTFFGRPFEVYVLGPILSKNIKKTF
jgi:hypothetical protein